MGEGELGIGKRKQSCYFERGGERREIRVIGGWWSSWLGCLQDQIAYSGERSGAKGEKITRTVYQESDEENRNSERQKVSMGEIFRHNELLIDMLEFLSMLSKQGPGYMNHTTRHTEAIELLQKSCQTPQV